jgi:hypothetical protein
MDSPSSEPESGPHKKKLSRKKVIKYSFFILFAGFIVSISAITHKFGPYMGQVVDLETGTPLAGVVVLMRFGTDGIEGSDAYAGGVETLTDRNGEFNIPANRVFVFYPVNVWDPNGYVTIFKPGYGAYPGHNDSGPLFMPNGSLPENEYVTIRLPWLKTIEERRRNLDDVMAPASMPDRKMRSLIRLKSQERVTLGFPPIPSE